MSRGIWTNPKYVRCSIPARLLFIGLVTEADDEGRLAGNAVEIKLLIFPADNFATPQIETWLRELDAVSLILRYQAEGRPFIEIPKFCEHQDSRHRIPSKIPSFQQVGGFRPQVDVEVDVDVEVYDHDHVGEDLGSLKGIPEAPSHTARRTPKTGVPFSQAPRGRRKGHQSALDTTAQFRRFYDAYPRHTAPDRAERAFRAALKRGVTLDQLLAAVDRQRLERQALQQSGEFCPEWPYPATWLNGGRWKDEPLNATAEAKDWEPPEIRAARGDTSGLAILFRKPEPEASQ